MLWSVYANILPGAFVHRAGRAVAYDTGDLRHSEALSRKVQVRSLRAQRRIADTAPGAAVAVGLSASYVTTTGALIAPSEAGTAPAPSLSESDRTRQERLRRRCAIFDS